VLEGVMMAELFSRPFRAGQVRGAPVRVEVTAGPEDCTRLAAAFGLPAVAALSGVFELAHEGGGVISAVLRLTARVTQDCVITLEPFEADVAETAALRFVPAARVKEGEAVELDAEALDGPDEIPYAGDTIDLGAALAEQLALSLDPYPRKPGAVLPEDLVAEAETPFAALKGRRGMGEPD